MACLDFLDDERDLGRQGSKDPLGSLGIDKSEARSAERIYDARRNDYSPRASSTAWGVLMQSLPAS